MLKNFQKTFSRFQHEWIDYSLLYGFFAGGCTQKCNAVLNCGHICPRICHIDDRDHLQDRCCRPCDRYICSEKHQCPKKCFEECDKCVITVEKTLSCGHTATLPCYVDSSDYKCLVMVEKVLPNCGHPGRVYCGVDPQGLLCSLPCNIPLSCGHQCTRKCHAKVSLCFMNHFLEIHYVDLLIFTLCING